MKKTDHKNQVPTSDPFEEYQHESDPTKRERSYAWYTAIGLQAVDGLETSDYLKETASKNIKGEISISEAQALIESYYKSDRKKDEVRTEEADIVASRIAPIIAEKGFTFSVAQYLSIHKRLFTGIYKHAGKIRDYNITKKEWVLDGDTVTYGNWQELRAMLDYDFAEEKAFQYNNLSMDEIIRHLARFISRLWQIHVFGEGNTRTTAVFFIKYLQSLGFDVTNDIFAKNAWYFRNAMVRANYNNLQKNVHETTEFLELFLRNLLLGENRPMQNRTMHISKAFKQDFEEVKQDSKSAKQDFDRLIAAGISVRSTNNILKLMKTFGFEKPFGRTDIANELGITKSPASELLSKLLAIEAVIPASTGRGKYRFNPEFFHR
ncbi:MAG: Fic family protein [Clostridia bacterium]|nr:Fic family protein [Clostridia bacterium]